MRFIMLTKQQRLIESGVNEIRALIDANQDNKRFTQLANILFKRLCDLEDCPQDRVALVQAFMVFKQLMKRHAGTVNLTGLEILLNAINDDYMAEFEEELYEKLSELTTAELRWLTEYSRNDKQVADLAAEVLDRRSGI